LFLEALSSGSERVAEALFRGGVVAFLLATTADGAIHLAGWHQFEQIAHLGIFAGMAVASVALVLRGSAPERKERSHATR